MPQEAKRASAAHLGRGRASLRATGKSLSFKLRRRKQVEKDPVRPSVSLVVRDAEAYLKLLSSPDYTAKIRAVKALSVLCWTGGSSVQQLLHGEAGVDVIMDLLRERTHFLRDNEKEEEDFEEALEDNEQERPGRRANSLPSKLRTVESPGRRDSTLDTFNSLFTSRKKPNSVGEGLSLLLLGLLDLICRSNSKSIRRVVLIGYMGK